MRSPLRTVRRKLLGETWTIPLGVAAALVLTLLFRALVSSSEWQIVGGFALAALVLATLIRSLPLGRSPNAKGAAAQTEQPTEHKG